MGIFHGTSAFMIHIRAENFQKPIDILEQHLLKNSIEIQYLSLTNNWKNFGQNLQNPRESSIYHEQTSGNSSTRKIKLFCFHAEIKHVS